MQAKPTADLSGPQMCSANNGIKSFLRAWNIPYQMYVRVGEESKQ